MKYILSILTILILSFSLFLNTSNANSIFNGGNETKIPYCEGDSCGLEKGIDEIKKLDTSMIVENKTAAGYIQEVVIKILGFLALIATIIIIYAGFNLLIGIGDEEKAKKTKNIIIYAILGLLIIFLSYPIITFILGILVANE